MWRIFLKVLFVLYSKDKNKEDKGMGITGVIDQTKIGEGGKSLEQLQTALHRYCRSVTTSNWDAEDLAQDTWLKAFGRVKVLEHPNPEALLLRIAKNTWIDQSRRKTVFNRILKQERPPVVWPENSLFEIEVVLHVLVKHLSPLQRTVFILRDVCHYANAEVAEMLATTEGAVKAALHRARRALDAVRDDLKKGGFPLPEEEGMRAYLLAFAVAYQEGDMATLVELSLRGEIDPVKRVGTNPRRLSRNAVHLERVAPRTTMQMAA